MSTRRRDALLEARRQPGSVTHCWTPDVNQAAWGIAGRQPSARQRDASLSDILQESHALCVRGAARPVTVFCSSDPPVTKTLD